MINSSADVSYVELRNLTTTAVFFVHELTHGLGSLHDLPGCCQNCIMAEDNSFRGDSVAWSTCTLAQLDGKKMECATRPLAGGSKALCGNGFFGTGEECDCYRYDFDCLDCCDIDKGC